MSASFTYGAIRTLMAEPNRQVSGALRSGLLRYSLRDVVACTTATRAFQILTEQPFDLICLDADLEDADVCESVRRLRDNKLGKDPFSNVVLFANPPMGPRVRQLVDSGADAIVIKPVAVSELISKIDQLINARKPFVVSSDYTGPDRRSAPRPGTMVIPLITVPSNMRQRALGAIDDNQHVRAVNQTWSAVTQQKIERQIFQIGWLLERIIPGGEKAAVEIEAIHYALNLVMVSDDLSERLTTAHLSELVPICQTLKENAQKLRDSGGEVAPEVTQSIFRAAKLLKETWSKPTADAR
jgi:CheY-like chemotaxis protein